MGERQHRLLLLHEAVLLFRRPAEWSAERLRGRRGWNVRPAPGQDSRAVRDDSHGIHPRRVDAALPHPRKLHQPSVDDRSVARVRPGLRRCATPRTQSHHRFGSGRVSGRWGTGGLVGDRGHRRQLAGGLGPDRGRQESGDGARVAGGGCRDNGRHPFECVLVLQRPAEEVNSHTACDRRWALPAVAGGVIVAVGAVLPWMSLFAGLHSYSGITGLYGRLVLAGGAVSAIGGIALLIRPDPRLRVAIGVQGAALTLFAAWVLLGLRSTTRQLDQHAFLVPRAGPGVFVVLLGALVATSLLLPSRQSHNTGARGGE